MSTKSGYVNGSDLLLKLGGKAFGHCTSHTTTYNSETKDRAVKPIATKTISAGLWKNKGVTGLGISISGEGLRFYGETENGYKDAVAAWKAGKSIDVECIERESENAYLKGKFVITSLEETAPAQDDATYKIDLENDGEPEVLDIQYITESVESPGIGG